MIGGRGRPGSRSMIAGGLALLAFSVMAGPARAQTVGAEVAGHQLTVGGKRLTELVVPVGVSLELGRLQLDANTAYARAVLEEEGGRTREMSGPTDLVVRVVLPVIRERIRLVAAATLPTGQATLADDELDVAAELATDLFALPVASFGSGRSATAAVAVAQPLGGWVLGLSGAYRVGGAYEPFLPTAGGSTLEFRPGDELRVRLALDRISRSGRAFRVAGSWSTSNPDEQNQVEIFQTGDRYLAETMTQWPMGRGHATVYAWDLYRTAGEVLPAAVMDTADATGISVAERPARNLLGAGVRMTIPLTPAVLLRPTGDVFVQTTRNAGALATGDGYLVRAGAGIAFRLGRMTLEPAVLGQYGTVDGEQITGFIVRGGLAWAR